MIKMKQNKFHVEIAREESSLLKYPENLALEFTSLPDFEEKEMTIKMKLYKFHVEMAREESKS